MFSDLERNRIYDLKANILKIEKCHSERLAGDLGHCEYSMTPDFNSASTCKKSFLPIFWPWRSPGSSGASCTWPSPGLRQGYSETTLEIAKPVGPPKIFQNFWKLESAIRRDWLETWDTVSTL